MTIVAREEKYLMMLRRATLGMARLLLVLATLALVVGGAVYIWASIVSSSEFRLPATADLTSSVDPCAYLTNADAETNGKDAEGPVPVKRVLSKCDASPITTPTFSSVDGAYNAFADDLVSMQKSLGWSYTGGEEGAKAHLRKLAKSIQERVLAPIRNDQDFQKLAIANAIAGYSARLRGVAVPSAAWVGDHQEDQTAVDQPPAERATVDRLTVAHLIATRFVQNQLAVTVAKAKTVYDETQEKAAAHKVLAVGALEAALSLFASFLALMLIFVFIKVEIDLRDIRDALEAAQPTETHQLVATV